MAISHKNIPTGERHPPKGFENAATNTVLKRGASNSEPVYGQVERDDIENAAIGVTKIANGAVTNPKLANNSVTNNKVQTGTISLNKLQTVTVSGSRGNGSDYILSGSDYPVDEWFPLYYNVSRTDVGTHYFGPGVTSSAAWGIRFFVGEWLFDNYGSVNLTYEITFAKRS